MKKTRTKNILKTYNRYLRKLRYLLENDRKSTKIGWLKKRLLKLKQTIETKINNYRLTTKRVVNTAAAVSALLVTGQAQNFELQLNPSNPFYEVKNYGVAQPHFIDFDEDGDDDIFLTGFTYGKTGSYIRDNGLAYFENTNGEYQKKTLDIFPEDLGLTGVLSESEDVIVVADIVDYDADGDLDLFVGAYEGKGIVYLENNEGSFTVNDEANPFSESIFSEEDFYDFELGDIDGDGILDAIISDEDKLKIYKLEEGVFVESEELTTGSQMSPTLIDYDGDGDLDLIIGNKYGSIDMYENTDGLFTIVEDHQFANVSLESNPSFAFSDINGDSAVDVIVGNYDGILNYFEKVGEEYEYIPYNEKGIHFYGAEDAIPEFADIDGDGDKDLLVGTKLSALRYIENTEEGFVLNNAENPFLEESILSMTFVNPRCGDVDGDGDADCHFMSGLDGFENYFENVEGEYTLLDSLDNPFVEFSSDENRSIQLEDFDNDGDLDLFIGNKYGEIKYYENVEGSYVEKPEVVAQVNQDDVSQIYFLDIDKDGDREMIQVDYYYDILTYEKVDGILSPVSGDESLNESLSGIASYLSFIDIDNDGDEDIVFSDYRNRALYVENLGVPSSVKNYAQSSETTISPNPATNVVQVEIPWNKSDVQIYVHQLNGQLIRKSSATGQEFKLNTSDLANGNYTLKMVSKDGQAVKKLTILK